MRDVGGRKGGGGGEGGGGGGDVGWHLSGLHIKVESSWHVEVAFLAWLGTRGYLPMMSLLT